ncbi:proton channel OtopLc isoform X8 [Penaeus vannamei]|uniref:Putative otopetrin-2 isoform X2 n=1 Tax=Penaeus vannamei TaxID=6689 RepID=A0A3R7PV52_PENVA|nr:proton channel OtopLc-like [Penaeus vannamei]ROT83518.1 putative otopetrin-2 isoform X2 [Penaeus vannamei]
MSSISIPIRLVLNSISESEASGSALVTPIQHRRRVSHGLPSQHPHRRRKVSAPPELLQHLGSAITHVAAAHAITGSANPDHADRPHPEFILSFAPGQTHLPEGLYSGSDSGVQSEYSSWAAPVSGVIGRDVSTPEVIRNSASDSIDDLAERRQTNENQEQEINKYYQSDSDCESIDDLQSPQATRKSVGGSGMNNPGFVHTEPTTLVLPVGSPPPLSRAGTDPSMASTASSTVGMVAPSRQRRNSMVLQLNLQGALPPTMTLPTAPPTTAGTRSVSMVSLNQNQPVTTHLYPNLHSDTQSIYSEVNYSVNHGYANPPIGSQAPAAGVSYKVPEQHQAHSSGTPSGHIDAVPQPEHHDTEEPQPTEPEKKSEWFTHTLSENLSVIYAVFLVMLGVVIYLADTFSGHDSAMAEGFNVFLIVAQLLWLFYVHVDVRRYVNQISRALEEAKAKQTDKSEQVQLEPTGDGQYQLRINLPEPRKTIPQHYGFTSGRHGGSLYLKIGATVFCFGYLIHTGLNLGQKILYLTEEDPAFDDCTCTTDVVMSVLQPVYAFYQLFFIFKYSNLIINRRKVLSRFGLMHCIGASLCYWIYTILQETLQAIFMKKSYANKDNYSTDGSSTAALYGSTGYDDDSDEVDDDDSHHFSGTKLSASSSAWSINYGCEKDTNLSDMINYTTPYLYPFSIEFNILMVGLWILLWENIGKTDRHTHIPSVEVTYEEDNSKTLTSNLIIYVDCHASNRGLFAGLLMTVATVISIILFFILSSSEDSKMLGKYVNGISEVILLSCMLITAAIAYNSIRVLDVMKHAISSVDNILLYVCLPCIFLYAFLSMVPSINNRDFLFVSVSVLQVSQVILQTTLICDGLRRCSNSLEVQHKKPGREVITYLVVTNVAMWLLQTFEIKSEEGNSNMYDFYGKELWTLLSHLTLPLALFYRFHSSVCLADMWKASYEAEE